MKENDSPLETGLPMQASSVESGVNTRQILENAVGYRHLGLFEEARRESEKIPKGDLYWEPVQELLVELDLDQERMTQAAQRGLVLLSDGHAGKNLVLSTAMALHHSGNSKKAYDTLMAHYRMFVGDVPSAYAFACYAAGAGEVDFAIKALLFNYQRSGHYWTKATIDADLEPIWIRGAAGNVSLDSSLALAHPVMAEVIETSAEIQKEIPIDFNIKDQVPGNCRDYLRINPATGFYSLNRNTPPPVRERYLYWQQDYKARTEKLALSAIQNAEEFVLDHQLEWAKEKAGAGHLLGARYHISFALGHRPKLLNRFAKELRPLGLSYFFDELMYAESFGEGFCVRLHFMNIARASGDVGYFLHFFEGISANLQSLTICLLQRANMEEMRGNRHFAIGLFKKVARRWPDDPVGYYNAIANLAREERWTEAKEIFDQAPKGYRILALSEFQRAQLENRETEGKSIGAEAFYGQPEWDERLNIIPETKKEQLALGEK